MLIEPASKVSTPVVVVMRTLSSVEILPSPPPKTINVVVLFAVCEETHVEPLKFTSVIIPECAAAAVLLKNTKPAVLLAPDELEALLKWFEVETYPVLIIPPLLPPCIKSGFVPLVLTPANITVIRLTQLGMLVKSMLVPLVDATAVPEVMPRIAPELIVTLADPSITVDIV